MATDKTVKTIFPVLGMSCAACAARVEKVLAHQPGVYAARINYAAANAAVEYDPARTAPGSLREAVRAAGYDLVTGTGADAAAQAELAQAEHLRQLKSRTLWAMLLALPSWRSPCSSRRCLTPSRPCGCSRPRWYSGWDAGSTSAHGANCGTGRPTWTRSWR